MGRPQCAAGTTVIQIYHQHLHLTTAVSQLHLWGTQYRSRYGDLWHRKKGAHSSLVHHGVQLECKARCPAPPLGAGTSATRLAG